MTDFVRHITPTVLCTDATLWKTPIDIDRVHFRERDCGVVAYYVAYDTTVLDSCGDTKIEALCNLLMANFRVLQ